MLARQQKRHPLESLAPVADHGEIIEAREKVKEVQVSSRTSGYLLELVEKSRADPRVKLGISPRGSLALYRTGQAMAWSQGRSYVLPDDIKSVAVAVLAHRIVLETKTRHTGLSKEEAIRQILESVAVPTS